MIICEGRSSETIVRVVLGLLSLCMWRSLSTAEAMDRERKDIGKSGKSEGRKYENEKEVLW